MTDQMKIAILNMKVISGDKDLNREKMLAYAQEACRSHADIILFPEMCLTGYDYYTDPEVPREAKLALAEDIHGETAQMMAEISQKYGSYIIYGAPELAADGTSLYNSAFITGPDGILGTYRKMHPFAAENTWCEKGSEPFLFETKWGPIGVGICYDTYRFPELMRYYVYKGARLYLNPTALAENVAYPGSHEAFRRYYSLLDYGVLCNDIYIASANLTGYDQTTYWGGGSCVLGPKVPGHFKLDVDCYGGDRDNQEESLDYADIDLSLAGRQLCQINAFTGEMDFRPEIYQKFYEK